MKVKEVSARKAQEIIQFVAQAVQHRVHERVAGVVSKCLAAVYDGPYGFKIHFEKKRGKTEARPVFVRDGHELDPEDFVGGGCLEVACFALRVVCLCMTKPAVRKLIVADEPFKAVHGRENRRRCAELVTSLAEEFGVQIILATGLDWLRVGKVVDLS